jgi:bacteriocin-like protein
MDNLVRKSNSITPKKINICMKTLQIANFEQLTEKELQAVNGGTTGLGLSSLNPTINSLLTDLAATTVAVAASLDVTLTDLTTNLDNATSSLTGGSGLLGGILGGGLLGGSGNGLLGGGLNL